MPLWTSLFSLLLAIVVVVFNLLVLLATAINPRLHTISNTLSCNLWLANCFTGIVGIFHNLFHSTVVSVPVGSASGVASDLLISTSTERTPKLSANPAALVGDDGEGYLQALGPQTLAALFNSTVSLLALLAMAFIQIFAKHQNWLPTSAPVRISACLWSVVVVIVFVNFALVQVTRSLSLIIAFQLALLSIFLVINLIIHPLNLLLASRSQQTAYLTKSITQSLWLLLHSLSFTLIAMMLVWESSQLPPTNSAEDAENKELVSLQLAAYSVHCIANPIIAMLRDPRLHSAIGSLVNAKDSRSQNTDYALIMQLEDSSQYYLPAPWIFRHFPPPPPYMSPAASHHSLHQSLSACNSNSSATSATSSNSSSSASWCSDNEDCESPRRNLIVMLRQPRL